MRVVLRRRRSLIPAQGWSASDNLGAHTSKLRTLKGFAVRRTLSGLEFLFDCWSQGSRKLEPWAEISERLRRYNERRSASQPKVTTFDGNCTRLGVVKWRQGVGESFLSHVAVAPRP